jgi:ATP-binding cassette, subfamily C, bacterial CydD
LGLSPENHPRIDRADESAVMQANRCSRQLFLLALSHKWWLGLLGVALLCNAGVVILQMDNLSRIIDGTFVQRTNLSELRAPIYWLAVAIVVRSVSFWLNELASQEIAARVKEKLRNRLFRSLIQRGPLFTQRERTGELAACTIEGVEKLDAWYGKFLPHALGMAITPATLILFVLWIDWPSAIVLLVTGPLIPVFMALIGMMAQRKTRQQWTALSRMSGHFLDVLQGLPSLHLFGQSSVQNANIAKMSEHFRRATMRVLRVAFLSGMVLELIASISTALVAVEIGVRLIEGLIGFQTGLLVLLVTPEFYLAFRQLGTSHHAGMEGVAAGERILEILEENQASQSATVTGPAPRQQSKKAHKSSTPGIPFSRRSSVSQSRKIGTIPPVTGPIRIQFLNVDYRYPTGPTPAVCRLNLRLEPGRIHLLTGDNGAGKTTIMKLLLRFIQPTGGTVLVNSRPLSQISPELWRRQVAFVSQDPHFFDGSVLDNLRAAQPEAPIDRVRAAARLAEADEFIMALPRGYETPISEAATRFSGGERQRLAIARAFLKGSPVLLCDEPTSHLDAVTGTKLRRAFVRLARFRTILIIAHPGSAPTPADIVLVLDNGHLVERRSQRSLSAQ